ncbi:MAG: lytic transglycosylase domain-containing protein [Anaeromyxobacteraceae bacterium]|nr:lytic transglycosylase domain-containing protein [Anaeromyxobacteraceae bacterium]
MSIAAVLAASTPIPYEAEIDTALAETAGIYPVPKALVIAVISVESDFRPRAVSPAGAKGLMQLMPYTARRVGLEERHLFDPAQNICGGVRLLAVLLLYYEGDVVSTLVAYNASPRRRLAALPRNGETPAYVWKVLAEIRRLSSSDVPRVTRPAEFVRPSLSPRRTVIGTPLEGLPCQRPPG